MSDRLVGVSPAEQRPWDKTATFDHPEIENRTGGERSSAGRPATRRLMVDRGHHPNVRPIPGKWRFEAGDDDRQAQACVRARA
jgi:hypothetical protein